MKYLVHIEPSKEIADYIGIVRQQVREDIVKVPSSMLHCTLMTLYTNPLNEPSLIETLEGIEASPFVAKTSHFDIFDENLLVLRLERSSGIIGLHKDVIRAMKSYIDWEENPVPSQRYLSDERLDSYLSFGAPYFGDIYNPHITIAEVGGHMLMDHPRSMSFYVTKMFLSRKVGDWETVCGFHLS